MTTAKVHQGTVERDPATGRRIVRVSQATIAAAQARLAIGKKLGITPSETVKSIAALGPQAQTRP